MIILTFFRRIFRAGSDFGCLDPRQGRGLHAAGAHDALDESVRDAALDAEDDGHADDECQEEHAQQRQHQIRRLHFAASSRS